MEYSKRTYGCDGYVYTNLSLPQGVKQAVKMDADSTGKKGKLLHCFGAAHKNNTHLK